MAALAKRHLQLRISGMPLYALRSSNAHRTLWCTNIELHHVAGPQDLRLNECRKEESENLPKLPSSCPASDQNSFRDEPETACPSAPLCYCWVRIKSRGVFAILAAQETHFLGIRRQIKLWDTIILIIATLAGKVFLAWSFPRPLPK
jgi:hypothetical protein